MATYSEKYKGWVWLPQERQTRQRQLRDLRQTHDKLRDNIRWIATHLPAYKDAAAAALDHYTKGLGKAMLLDLTARGRRYQPMTPEEFDAIYRTFLDLLEPWRALHSDPIFAALVKKKSREIREQNKIIQAHNAERHAREAAIFRRMAEGDLFGAIDQAARDGLL